MPKGGEEDPEQRAALRCLVQVLTVLDTAGSCKTPPLAEPPHAFPAELPNVCTTRIS